MIKRRIVTAILILSVGAWTTCVFAEDSQDVLKELDAYMKTEEKPVDTSQKGLFGQLADHFNADLELRTSSFFKPAVEVSQIDTGNDNHRYVGKIRAKWSSWTGSDRWRFHGAGWFEAGTEEGDYAGITRFMTDTDNRKRYAELDELFLNLSPGGAFSLTAGKKIFKNGLSTIYSPADRYTSADLHDPVNPVRTGAWQLTCDYSRGDTVYTAALLPFYQEKKIQGFGSRWIASELPYGYTLPFANNLEPGAAEEMMKMIYYYGPGLLKNKRVTDLLDQGATIDVREDLPGNNPGDWGWFGRVKKSIGVWDTFLSAYYGPSFYPVLKLEVSGNHATLIKETPGVSQLAGGFSTTWGATELHGEALYSYSRDDHDDSYVNYTGGICHDSESLAMWLGLKKLDFVLEYAGEKLTDEQDLTNRILSSRYLRIGRNDLIASALATVTDDLSLHYLSDFALSDNAYFQRIGASLRIRSGVVVTLDFEFFNGSAESYFGRWSGNDRMVTAIKWSL